MPFKPGQSGNPGGQRQEKIWRNAVRAALNAEDPVKKKRKLQLLAEKLVETALEGDVAAFREIADRTDGKVPQAIVGDEDFAPVLVKVMDEWARNHPPK